MFSYQTIRAARSSEETGRQVRFEQVWQRHRPRIHRLVARLSGDVNLADDLTQEVAVKAYKAFSGFRSEATALTWLSRIAINAVHRHREKQRLDTLPLEAPELASLSTPHSDDPQALALQAGLRPIIWAALDRLTEELRTPLILQIYEDLKYREIAVLLDIPLGTVKSRLHTALIRLREELKDHEL